MLGCAQRNQPRRNPRGTNRTATLLTGVMRLSVLDLVPVRSDQTTADALAAMHIIGGGVDQAGGWETGFRLPKSYLARLAGS